MATQFHTYQGTEVETSHRTIYVESHRELSDSELQQFMGEMVDKDIDNYEPEPGVKLSRGSSYHSERTATPD